MYQTLEIATRNQVATLWMNRPDVHNAFDEALIAAAEQTGELASLDGHGCLLEQRWKRDRNAKSRARRRAGRTSVCRSA